MWRRIIQFRHRNRLQRTGHCGYDGDSYQSLVARRCGLRACLSKLYPATPVACGCPPGQITSSWTQHGHADVVALSASFFPLGNIRLIAILVREHLIRTLTLCCVLAGTATPYNNELRGIRRLSAGAPFGIQHHSGEVPYMNFPNTGNLLACIQARAIPRS